VCSSDLDGDGDLDIAVCHYVADTIALLFNNGSGTFIAPMPPTMDTFADPRSISIGDLDGDGDQDIAVGAAGVTNTASVHLNNGTGTFALPLRYGTGEMPRRIGLADFDNDGELDIAITNNMGGQLSILLNRTPTPGCLGDCDLSGCVDFNDLVAMVFLDGQMMTGPCDADGSGTIDFNDLVSALFFFGPCP